MAKTTKHVAIAMSLHKQFDREVLEGIACHVHTVGHWQLYIEDDPSQKIPDFKRQRFDGVIADLDDPTIPERIAALGIPVVGVGGIKQSWKQRLGISTVETNNAKIAEMAAEHLLSRGFEHFAFVGMPSRTIDPWIDQRREAFVEHVIQRGFSCATFTGRHVTSRQWRQLHDALATWLRDQPRPLGVMACNDGRARHVMEVCHQLKFNIPGDVAVIGADNDVLFCSLTQPPLSSVVQGTRKIGREAALLLDRIMRHRLRKRVHMKIDPVTVAARQSTDVLATADAVVAQSLSFIHRHAAERIQVSDVAEHVGVSRSNLDGRFRKILNRTVRQELQRRRLNLAIDCLRDTALPVEQVATRCGFNDAQYMNAVFRRELNRTPGQFRTDD